MPRPDGKNGSVTVPMALLKQINEVGAADAEAQNLVRPFSASHMVEKAWRFYMKHREELDADGK